jgi:hypothetical protein
MPMGDLAAPQAFGTGSPGELAQQPSAASLLAQLFGSIQPAPETPPQVVYPTKNPLTAITDKDINRGIDIGLGFSGGGLGIKAYHGSPHSFERFDPSKIGTGEGAQAYGHGLYFAEQEATAKAYRDALAYKNQRPVVTKDPTFGDVTILEQDPTRPGKMYEVDINAVPEHFLDWDKPLSQQHPHVQEALGKIGSAQKNRPLSDTDLGKDLYYKQTQGLFNESASQRLREAGIPGIRYLDQGSRAAGKGSRNYVVFDPNLIDIKRKFGLLGAPAAGGMGALAAQNYTLPQEGM